MTYWAVIWDLDGTIIDSGKEGMRRFFLIARQRGLAVTPEMEEQIKSMWGKHGSDFVKHFWPDHDAKAFYADWVTYDLAYPHKLVVGVDTLIQELAAYGFYQAISTSRDRETTLQHLNHHKLTSCFKRIVCGDDSSYKKPDPRSGDAIVEDLRMLDNGFPRGVLYVGDMMTDYNLAIALGVKPIVLLAGSLNTREEFLTKGVPVENILDSVQDLSVLLDADL